MIINAKMASYAIRVEFIQKRIFDSYVTKDCKKEMLQSYWERVEAQIKYHVQMAGAEADQFIKNFFFELTKVSTDVRNHVL